jgi:protein-S-isoprenylcysteine O-methyltransferase Ste14
VHLFDQRILGIAILFQLGILVIVKQIATGSIIDKTKGTFLVQFVNIFNLFFLLFVNPLAAILLITRSLTTPYPTQIIINEQWVLVVLEIIGLVFFVMGFLLMAWALVFLGRNYQLGGNAPRSEDKLVDNGPYRLIRHPMYAAALSISLGLACLIQSWAFFLVFCIYLVLILPLISIEEDGLQKAYGEKYGIYQQKTRKLVPLVY